LFGRNTEVNLHILVVSQYFWPENFRINDLVGEWRRRGHLVTVLTGIPNYPLGKVFDPYLQQPGAFSNFSGANILRVPMLPRGTGNFRLIANYLSFVIGASLWGPWLLRKIDVDIIFVYEPSPVTVGLPAILFGKIKKAPTVFWVLDLWPETLAAIGAIRSPRLLAWVGSLVKFIYNRCALVLGQSRGFLESIANYCTDKSKIRYFPNWAEDVFLGENINPASEVSEFKGLTVLFAGNIGEAQDIPVVIDAAERLKKNSNIRWVIVGDGRKTEWLKSEILKRGLERCVLLPGRFPVERMPSFYAHADALLVSLKSDPVFSLTIPGKVQSYLMAGIPLLGMLDGEGAAVIHEANAGLTCRAGDSIGLVNAVLAMAEMTPEERKKLGLNGRKYAQQEFDRTQLVNQSEALLNEAVMMHKRKS
jgi:colanic acid biosynthesis glycosyl transferase WcaI